MRVRHRLIAHPLLIIAIASGIEAIAGGCATTEPPPAPHSISAPVKVAGIWDGTFRETVTETLVTATDRQVLHRNIGTAQTHATAASIPARNDDSRATSVPAQPSSTGAMEPPRLTTALQSQAPVDLSGVWVWEHRGQAATGDEKQEHEEWHVDQDGDHISGYYDRVVREISTDGQAFRCSMNLEFEIATRYQIHGEVRGNQVVIYEKGFEVLAPNACDNGQRRLDAYEGLAAGDEVRLMWGVGAQVLRRAHPDVPTQRF